MSDILFIIGVGRSGTTLIQSMLNAHPEIHFSKESHFVKRYIAKEIKGNLKAVENKEQMKALFSKDSMMSEYMNDVEDVLNEVYDRTDIGIKSSEIFLQLLIRNSGKDIQYVGEKDPMNVNFLEEIKFAFPQAKVLHIIRDPRAVISSRIKSEWGKGRSLFFHCLEYNYSIQKAKKQGVEKFGDNYFEFRYEDLVDNSEKQLREICKFLDLDFDKEMLDYQRSSKSLVRKEELKWKSNVFQPVLTENKDKWRRELTDRQISLIELYLDQIIKKLKYTTKKRAKPIMYFINISCFAFLSKLLKLVNG